MCKASFSLLASARRVSSRAVSRSASLRRHSAVTTTRSAVVRARTATAAARRRRRRRPARSVIARAKASSMAERPPGYRSRQIAYSRKERPDHRRLVGPSLLVPEPRGLPELVAQERALRVLRLPAHEARPRPQQGLVDDLDAVRARLALAGPAS